MNEHVTDWLGAYHDGELQGRRLRQVEAHLAECATCRAELERLRALATLLQESPAPADLTPPDRFVAQVGLRLPRRPEWTVWQRGLEIGWRMVPLGLLGAWAFVEAVFFVAQVALIALQVGVGGDFLARLGWDALADTQPQVALRSTLLIQLFSFLGLDLSGASRSMLQWLSTWSWGVTLHLVTLVVVGLLYFSWLASWWARRQHRRTQPMSTPTSTADSRVDGRVSDRA